MIGRYENPNLVICAGADSERILRKVMKSLRRSESPRFRKLKFTPNPHDRRIDKGLFELIDDADEVAHIMEDAKATHGLTYREREIIKLHYGLGDGFNYTYEEIGRIFHITRQRAQTIERRAFEKIRKAAKVHYGELGDYEAVRQIETAA